jgi:uncharacterized membrane protein YphA (DoxX/SURF4 family)
MILKNYLKNKDTGFLLIRLGLAFLFIFGGTGKLMGLEGFSNMVWGSMALAFIVAIVELFAGIGLLLGVMVRESGFALAIVMLFAIFIAHNPITMEGQLMNALIRFALLTTLLGLAFTGSGKSALLKD